jgi:hypothetical protein
VGGVRTVLLSSTTLPPTPPVNYTPDAVTSLDTVERPVKVLLSDPVLSQILATNGASAPTPGSWPRSGSSPRPS